MAVSSVPTDSQRKSAQLHLSRRARWSYVRNKQTGQEYVIVPSSDGQRAYYVRQDGNGCSCPAYVDHNYKVCSHMLAVRLASGQDAAPIVMEPSKSDEVKTDAVETYKRIFDICRYRGCHEDAERHEIFCSKHLTVSAF